MDHGKELMPVKLALPVSKREWVHTPPALVNNKNNLRYVLSLPNKLNLIVDTYKNDEKLQLRVMPSNELRYLRMHHTSNINDSTAYSCMVKNPKELLRAMLRFVTIPEEKVKQLESRVGLKLEDERLAYLRPYLSTEPIYCGSLVTYMFELPNGYTAFIKANGNGTFNVSAQLDDGRGSVDLGLLLFKREGLRNVLYVDNNFAIKVLNSIYHLPKPEKTTTLFDEIKDEYWNSLDEKLDNDESIENESFEGFVKNRMDTQIRTFFN